MASLNIARVVDAFQSRIRSSVVATVADFQQLTPKLARVIVAYNSIEGDVAGRQAALTQALGGRAVPVLDSFRSVTSYTLPSMVGFVSSNNEVLDFAEAQARGMHAMTANVLMDPADESTWEVQSSGGVKMLVRQGVEDLRGVLSTAKVSVHRAPQLASLGVATPATRSFAAYVDPKFNTVRYGYVVSASPEVVEILPFPSADEQADDRALFPPVDNSSEDLRGDGNAIARRMADRCAPTTVGMENLVELSNFNGNDSFAAIAAPVGNDRQAMIDYYKKVYSYAPEYFEKVKEIIQGHAGL